jgi:BatD DUF11 like domain
LPNPVPNTLLALTLAFLIFGADSRSVQAQSRPPVDRPKVSVTMTLSPTKAKLGDQLSLTIRVSIQQRYRGRRGFFTMQRPNYDLQVPPSLKKDFTVVRSTPFQMNNIVGSQQSYRSDYNFAIRPRRTGRLLIPPARVVFKGRTYSSRSAVVNVSTGPAPPPSLPGQLPSLTGDEDLFVHAVANKVKAYVGEQVTITWYLYYKSPVARQAAIVTRPTTDNFFSEEIPFRVRTSTHTTIGGQVFTVTPVIRRALFPLKAGKLRVGALGVEAYLDYYQKVLRRSAVVSIEVLDLPTKNVPAGFHPKNVGQFKVTSEVGQARIDAHSATSLKVTVQGTGFMQGLKVDRIKQMPGFKVRFAGQKTEMASGVQLGGKHIHEYVLIPTAVGAQKVPPICFPHFDPTLARYVTNACSKPVEVTVTGKLTASVSSTAAGGGTDNELRRRLKPILQASHLRNRTTKRLHKTPWLLWLLILLPLMVLLSMVLIRVVRSLDRDTGSRRRRQARGHARRRLRLAASYLKDGDRVSFFTEIASVIQELLTARLGVRVQGITAISLEALLEESEMSPALKERILRDLEVCDFARFAPAASGEAEMQDVLARTRKLIGDVERAQLKPVSDPSSETPVEAPS